MDNKISPAKAIESEKPEATASTVVTGRPPLELVPPEFKRKCVEPVQGNQIPSKVSEPTEKKEKPQEPTSLLPIDKKLI